ncbi:MAG: sugar ABC transporter permease, partial [Lachnospiraceae bacterium]|nr:sugar ABC transporter permease [Lachnospiraceae bacterium]
MEKEVQKENTSESIYLRYIKRRAGLLKKDIRRHKTSYLFILPYCLLFTVFILAPVLVSIGLSFTYFNVLETPRFVGWQNYVDLFFADEVFLTAVKNTFLFAVITGPIGYFMALFIAWMINDIRNKKV